ncbi:MAG: acetolactate decarboxylase [Bacteroidia bacterium]|nr:acetolactate decarboxylase [Bacteroidia bacterium]
MNNSAYKILVVMFLIVIASCQSNNMKVNEVKYSGALKTIMSGNIQPVLSLDSLSNYKNLYALGAVENLKGEIQIFDGKPSNSFVVDGSMQIKDGYDLKATLLVYAEVKEWNEFVIKGGNKDELEKAIFETAKGNGLNEDQPFPFLLDGRVATLDWHVIDWKEGDTDHSHDKHKASGLNGKLMDREVQILGFYSSKHKAVFTHHTTNMHLHFKTADNALAGHIDDLSIGETIRLKLPRQ